MNARTKAFAVHLAISAAVVTVALILIYGFWYRPPFASLHEVYTVTLTLVSVDLVVGPLLTLVVYNPAKKSLKFDLALIALMQIAALAYGMKVCFEQRPIYAVYNEGKFSSVNPDEYVDVEMAKIPKNHPYPRYSLTGPEWVGAKEPAGLSDADRYFLQFSRQDGGGLRQTPRFYMPYKNIQVEAAAAGKKISEIDFNATESKAPLSVANPKRLPVTQEQREELRDWIKDLGKPADQVVLVPLVGSARVGVVALEAATGNIVAATDVAPWWAY